MKISRMRFNLSKKIKLSLLASFIVIIGSSSVFAGSIPICVQNKEISVGSTAPYISNTNQTMIPLRAVGNVLGLKLGWQAPYVTLSGTNVATNKPITVKANTAAGTLTVNSTLLRNCIQIKNGRSYVSLRVLAQVFGYNVDWVNNKVYINKPGTPVIPSTPTAPSVPTTPTDNSTSAYENKVLELVNIERQKAGVSPLTMDETLRTVARKKSEDMQVNKYFDHNSPTYGSPFDMMKQFGVTYRTAGENIAMGQRTPEEVVTAWMNSTGHRANILNSSYTHIGVGYVANGNYWTQEFIGK